MGTQLREYENYIKTKYGYCYYAFEYDGEYFRNPIIYNLYIYPEYRRQGHAKDIIVRIINLINGIGCVGSIEIEAEPQENSISYEDLKKFYIDMGLQVIPSGEEDIDYDEEPISPHTNRRIPISAAKWIAHEYEYPEIVIFGYDPVTLKQHITTYGKTKSQCVDASKAAGFLKKALGWPE